MKSKKILLRFDPSYNKCPSCGEVNTLRRSRTKNLWENILKATGIYKMYRCRKCNWRGALSTIVVTAQSLKNLVSYLVVLAITLFIILQVIKSIK